MTITTWSDFSLIRSESLFTSAWSVLLYYCFHSNLDLFLYTNLSSWYSQRFIMISKAAQLSLNYQRLGVIKNDTATELSSVLLNEIKVTICEPNNITAVLFRALKWYHLHFSFTLSWLPFSSKVWQFGNHFIYYRMNVKRYCWYYKNTRLYQCFCISQLKRYVNVIVLEGTNTTI